MTAPWFQMADETDNQYRSFLAYRDLPPIQRSIRNSTAAEMELPVPYDPQTATARARREHGTKKRKREAWSSANQWVGRVMRWDEHQAAVRLSEHRDHVAEMTERHASRGRFLQRKALDAVRVIERSGRTFLTKPSDGLIIRAIRDGAEIERAAYGVDQLGAAVDLPVPEDRTASFRDLFESDPRVAAAAALLLRARAQAHREMRSQDPP